MYTMLIDAGILMIHCVYLLAFLAQHSSINIVITMVTIRMPTEPPTAIPVVCPTVKSAVC